LTYIFISHDLAVVKFIADEVVVMNNGRVVEMADKFSIYERPQHEYTRKLLDSIPKGTPKSLTGDEAKAAGKVLNPLNV
jgi:peptide/nickel transport system ATP-binding protein